MPLNLSFKTKLKYSPFKEIKIYKYHRFKTIRQSKLIAKYKKIKLKKKEKAELS
jgi:hypothetical protein